MTFTASGVLASFLLACLVWYLFKNAIDILVKDPKANEAFTFLLLVICIIIALALSVFIKI